MKNTTIIIILAVTVITLFIVFAKKKSKIQSQPAIKPKGVAAGSTTIGIANPNGTLAAVTGRNKVPGAV